MPKSPRYEKFRRRGMPAQEAWKRAQKQDSLNAMVEMFQRQGDSRKKSLRRAHRLRKLRHRAAKVSEPWVTLLNRQKLPKDS